MDESHRYPTSGVPTPAPGSPHSGVQPDGRDAAARDTRDLPGAPPSVPSAPAAPAGPYPPWSQGSAAPTYQQAPGYAGAHQTQQLPGQPGHLGYSAGQQATPAHPARRRRGPIVTAIAGGALVIALVAGGTGAAVGVAVSDRDGSPVTISQATGSAPVSTDSSGLVEKAAATALKSVVTIQVTSSAGSGTGSGVVLDTAGHILTNNHVVEAAGDSGKVTVVLSDGRTRTATVAGRDATSDIAVITVADTSGLTPATFAASSTVRTGQTVLAVGAPLGLSNTVTQGIVSAQNRPVRTGSSQSDDTVIDAVQTDAAINPGNSGGALVDLSGRVVGINSAIASVSSSSSGQSAESGNIGVGFAIPADTALKVAKQLIADGTASHAALGVTAQDVQNGTGAQIGQVTSGSGADKAGLKAGDVITKVGDRRIDDSDTLVAAVRSYDPGTSVSVTYLRGGQTSTVKVTLTSSDA